MGYRVLQIAVSGKNVETIHDEFGVVATDAWEEIPESPVTGAMLPNGAYLLYVNDDIEPNEDVLHKLSRGASLLSCHVNETVMNSFASAWVDGVEQWSVLHVSEQGITHLQCDGALPDEFPGIKDRQLALQHNDQGVDYVFDVPVELFLALGGVRYDRDIEGTDGTPWQVLSRTATEKRRARGKWWPFG